ncbi:MAG: enoyl-CoA hydratase/isomerase family protein [Dehalococcoidia bacterium]|nr:enoyl-CoA hydratase/isomerase family protein [Dehalococcoidia bacterium]
MAFSNLVLQKKSGIAVLTLNRPRVLNATDSDTCREMVAAIKDIEQDGEIGVAILTGAGKAFSAGQDMKELRQVGTREPIVVLRTALAALAEMTKPVIAAVNGYCDSAGLEMVLTCDVIVASENAVFVDHHARFGLIHGGGATQRLPRWVGRSRAMEMLLTGEEVSAQEAYVMGLASHVAPHDKLLARAEELARKILRNDPASVKGVKFLIRQAERMDLAAGLELEGAENERWWREGRAGYNKERLKALWAEKKASK